MRLEVCCRKQATQHSPLIEIIILFLSYENKVPVFYTDIFIGFFYMVIVCHILREISDFPTRSLESFVIIFAAVLAFFSMLRNK